MLSIVFLAIAGLLTFVSMYHGMVVISKAYRRADGRDDTTNLEPWSTEALRTSINRQAKTGLLALLLFAGAIVASFFASPVAHGLKISLPENLQQKVSTKAETLTVTGQWSELKIDDGDMSIELSPTDGKTSSLKVEDE